jgi:hypothetical protein
MKAEPPSGAFGGMFPQNVRTEGSEGLAADPCHRDSDRIDTDGLPKVGAAVWPRQAYCNTVRCWRLPSLSLLVSFVLRASLSKLFALPPPCLGLWS